MNFEFRRGIPQCTLRHYEEDFRDRHRLHDVVAWWAARRPGDPAMIHHDRKQTFDWLAFRNAASALALALVRMGLRKGDFLAASLPFLPEHIFLEYACFQIGVIHAPLDPRLPPDELLRCLSLIRPKAYVFPGQTPAADFRELGKAVQAHCPFIGRLIQVSPPEETIAGAEPFAHLTAGVEGSTTEVETAYRRAATDVGENDPAQVIFTTGSTGSPKPALLSHRNITCQNLCLGAAFGFGERTRLLVNLPPFHVGGQAEALMTTLFWGGTAVVLTAFDAARSLDAIRQHRVNVLGQIPAMFEFEWRLPDYAGRDLSSLEMAVYGGQQVQRPFLERLASMAPKVGTGLGLTESAGFCTYTPPDASVDDIQAGIGYDMPIYPMSIRNPMMEDGAAGEELPDGEVGYVCFRGPQTFLGYANDPAATARAISTDGFLYTGDMGFKGSNGLHFAGRAKWIIKPAGHQVFPGDVENHICALSEQVSACAAVGVEHRLLSEAIMAFVEKKPGAELTLAQLRRHARYLRSYMRPLHYVLLEAGQMPLNRAAKCDYMCLRQMASREVERLRSVGRWDM